MSDQQTKWRLWQPENLLAADQEPEIEVPVSAAADISDDQLQMELKRRREQAEQKGFAQGHEQGVEQGREQGRQEGLALGREEGRAQGLAEAQAEQQQLVQQLNTLIEGVRTALQQLDSVIPARLVQLSLSVARTMLGKQLNCDHDILLEKIRQMLQREVLFKGELQLLVSQKELDIVQREFGATLASHGWAVRGDEHILPGGCRITSAEGELDATVSTQWQALCQLSREDYEA